MKYKQLITEQKYQIFALLQTGTVKKEIAEIVNTSVSTVYREIARNKGKRNYTPVHAQMLADERKERYAQAHVFDSGQATSKKNGSKKTNGRPNRLSAIAS